MTTVDVRPLEVGDIEAARVVQTRAFEELDRALGEPPWEVTDAAMERQRGRFQHFIAHDPAGSWVATVDGEIAGSALALRRESLWGLSLLVVSPDHQSQGIGRALLDASLRYADGVGRAIILSSRDPRAIRRYSLAGFDLFPQIGAAGKVDPARLERPGRSVRTGGAGDSPFADRVDVLVRGAPRGPDHERILRNAVMYVADNGPGEGYAYLREDGRIVSVAATDDDTASALLWACLAHPLDTDDRNIDHITGEQQWAVRVAVQAGMRLSPGGPVFWRGTSPPRGYLPDGAYL